MDRAKGDLDRGTRAPAHSTEVPHAQRRSAVAALTSSALALPGLAGPASADAPVEAPSANYSFSYYREDNLSPGKWDESAGGSRERYQIFAHQFNLLAPVTTRIDTGFDLVFESMSGASPWWVTQDQQTGEFLQVMSGATIVEQRVDGRLNVNHYFDRGRIGLSGGVSSENDYLSGSFGLDIERNYNDRNTVLNAVVVFSWDTITPSDPEFHDHPVGFSADKKTRLLDVSLSQILYRNAIVQVGLSYKNSEGYLDDPYKKIEVDVSGDTVGDRRPGERHQVAPYVMYRQFFPAANAALHFDTTGQWDSWDVLSWSFDLAWYQTLFEIFQIVPSFRYYSQSQAFFYGPVFRFGAPEFGTSDYRLSPYGVISYGLKGVVNVAAWPNPETSWVFQLGYQRYLSNGGYALSSVVNANPGLVDYHLFSVRLGATF